MKTIASRKVLVLGGILVAALAAGCYGGGRGYSNNPYGYNGGYGNSYSSNGGYYSSNPYDGSYGSTYPYNSGYYVGRSYPQSYGNSNSYSAGYQNGVRADEASDRRQDRVADQHIAVTRDRDHAVAAKQRSSVDRDDYTRKDSHSEHSPVRN
jgi:hypothetical protein